MECQVSKYGKTGAWKTFFWKILRIEDVGF